MHTIKFGTDGWRALIGDAFTVENVKRISEAVSHWMLHHKMDKIILGYDTRFGGQLFSEAAALVFASQGIKVLTDQSFVTTPMISYATKYLNADLGVVITASHNPPGYNGYKLKGKHGGPALQEHLSEIESLIPSHSISIPESYENYVDNGTIQFLDLEQLYLDMLKEHFDLKNLRKFGPSIAYDSMFGAGKKLMRRIFPDALHLHFEDNPGFEGVSPEPIDRNLGLLTRTIQEQQALKIGIANDGDADRIGLFDENGQFIDSHHILLLLLYYLVKIKKQSGKVLASAAVTEKLEKLAKQYGLAFEYTKIGFKYITPLMLEEDVLLAGEEAGGMAVKAHLPERDGIYNALLILQLMQDTGKSLRELVEIIYLEVGAFAYNRVDLKLSEAAKNRIVDKCAKDGFSSIAGFPVIKIQKVDGYRFFLGENSWLMIRPSGTEPVLRIYAQAESTLAVQELLNKTIEQLTN